MEDSGLSISAYVYTRGGFRRSEAARLMGTHSVRCFKHRLCVVWRAPIGNAKPGV